MKKLTIGFCKLGIPIRFNRETWPGAGGDSTISNLIIRTAIAYPQHTLVIFGKSDFNDFAVNLPSNVKYVFSDKAESYHEDAVKNRWNYNKTVDWQAELLDKMPELDCAVVFAGLAGEHRDSYLSFFRKDEDRIGVVCPEDRLLKYASQQQYFLQHSKVPWMFIGSDPRHLINYKDIFMNPPTALISAKHTVLTYTGNYTTGRYTTETREQEFDWKYEPLEELGIIYKEVMGNPMDKPSNYNLLAHGCSMEGHNRSEILVDYIKEDTKVYGKWKDKENDSRFKGRLEQNKIAEVMAETRYTFCVPMGYGWCTPKIREMICCGTIPFLHKSYGHDVELPKFLYVDSPHDLFSKMSYLDNNPERMEEVWNECLSLVPESFLNGKHPISLFTRMLKTHLNISL